MEAGTACLWITTNSRPRRRTQDARAPTISNGQVLLTHFRTLAPRGVSEELLVYLTGQAT